MPFPQTPLHKILTRMVDMTTAANVHTAFGLSTPFTVRHMRNRISAKTERPAITLQVISVEADRNFSSMAEAHWALTVAIVVDMELPSEASGGDPTGWNQLQAVANYVASLFLAPGNALLTLVDDTTIGDTDPDEESTPDDGRLAQDIVVLYRTLRSDLNAMLNSEENA